MKPEKIGANSNADYYRLGKVMLRVSVRFPVPPVCLSCRRNDCEHVKDLEDLLSQAAPAAA